MKSKIMLLFIQTFSNTILSVQVLCRLHFCLLICPETHPHQHRQSFALRDLFFEGYLPNPHLNTSRSPPPSAILVLSKVSLQEKPKIRNKEGEREGGERTSRALHRFHKSSATRLHPQTHQSCLRLKSYWRESLTALPRLPSHSTILLPQPSKHTGTLHTSKIFLLKTPKFLFNNSTEML